MDLLSQLREVKVSYQWKLVKLFAVFILRSVIFIAAILAFSDEVYNIMPVLLFSAFSSNSIIYILKTIANALGMDITLYEVQTSFWGKEESYEIGDAGPILKLLFGLLKGLIVICVILLAYTFVIKRIRNKEVGKLVVVISFIICMFPFIQEGRAIVKNILNLKRVKSDIKKFKSSAL